MKRLSAKVFICLLFVFSVCTRSSLAQGLNVDEAKQFLHDSGLSELISSLPSTMGQQLDAKRLSSNSSAEIDKASKAITTAVQRVDGEKIALVYLSTDNRAVELAETLKFLASPLGQRISAAERLASRPEAQEEMKAYAQAQFSKPVNEQRASLIEDLSSALNADQVVMQLMKGVYFSVLDAVKVINPARALILESQMTNEWQSMEPMLSQQFSSFMLMGANYSYRNLSDEDLKAYIQFLKSDSGQAYWQVGIDIIDLYIQGFVSELVALLSSRN
jgi:hypothetical protein